MPDEYPNTTNGYTAHIGDDLILEYYKIFRALFEIIDEHMTWPQNLEAYTRITDDDHTWPLNHPWLLAEFRRIDPVLADAIEELYARLVDYTGTEDGIHWTIQRQAKSAITRAGGSYGEGAYTWISTPDGWKVVHPVPEV